MLSLIKEDKFKQKLQKKNFFLIYFFFYNFNILALPENFLPV